MDVLAKLGQNKGTGQEKKEKASKDLEEECLLPGQNELLSGHSDLSFGKKSQKKQPSKRVNQQYQASLIEQFVPTSDYGDFEVDVGSRVFNWELPGVTY